MPDLFDPSNEVREPRVGPQRVELRVHAQLAEPWLTLFERLLEPRKGLVVLAELRVKDGEMEGGNVCVLGGQSAKERVGQFNATLIAVRASYRTRMNR
jgi:hypothetical protein